MLNIYDTKLTFKFELHLSNICDEYVIGFLAHVLLGFPIQYSHSQPTPYR